MGYLLDTDICIYLLHGKFSIDKRMKEVGEQNCYISILTALQLKIGEKISRIRNYSNKENVQGFIDSMNVLPIDNAIDLAAEEYARLERAGTPLRDIADLLIGCTAIVEDLAMVTANGKHLGLLKGIQIVDWRSQ